MALSVLVSSLAVTTLGQTVSPELTTPEGADPVGDKAEEGFVLTQRPSSSGVRISTEDVPETSSSSG